MRNPAPFAVLMGALIGACATEKPVEVPPPPAPSPPPPFDTSIVPRLQFNRAVVERGASLFWTLDQNGNRALDPDELAVTWGGGSIDVWVKDGAFTQAFRDLYASLGGPPATEGLAPDEVARRQAVLAELAQGRPTLLRTVITDPVDAALVGHIEKAAQLVERIHARQNGVFGLEAQIPGDDAASRSLFFRNQGPACEAPKTEKDPNCHALPSKAQKVSGLYPASIQKNPAFCEILEKRKDADALLAQFVTVQHRATGTSVGDPAIDDLEAVPYHVAYKDDAALVAAELLAAAKVLEGRPEESAFKTYLEAAAKAFGDDSWFEADKAWKAMTATNSKWYLRVGPDEVYFEPCSRKAGFHVSFALINQESLAWQAKLDPVKKDMEGALAKFAGPPYRARAVGFELPDFIDIVLNAGDARSAHGATIGQSLPNWGPVAESGGRTVAMTNLYTDPDSEAAFMEQAASLLCASTMAKLDPAPRHGTLSTVLHEAAHNLGPAHEYKVKGKTDDQIFGGPLASTLEELKSQTAALYFAGWLVKKGLLSAEDAEKAHLRDVTWAFGHIAQGMMTASGKPKPYSQLAAIQMGWLLEKGTLKWNATAKAANGSDDGCFDVDLATWDAHIEGLAKVVLGIKGRGDKTLAEKTRETFVKDGTLWAALRGTIQERWLRAPKASFVYAIEYR